MFLGACLPAACSFHFLSAYHTTFLFEHNVGSAFYCMHANNQLIFFEVITGINVSLLVKEECQFIDAVGSPILTEQSTVTYQNNQLQEQKKY